MKVLLFATIHHSSSNILRVGQNPLKKVEAAHTQQPHIVDYSSCPRHLFRIIEVHWVLLLTTSTREWLEKFNYVFSHLLFSLHRFQSQFLVWCGDRVATSSSSTSRADNNKRGRRLYKWELEEKRIEKKIHSELFNNALFLLFPNIISRPQYKLSMKKWSKNQT